MSVGVIAARARRSRIFLLTALLSLEACVGAPGDAPRPMASVAPAPLPAILKFAPQPAPAPRICVADLDKARVNYLSVPDQDFGGGCTTINSVKLLDIGTPVTNLGTMTCQLADRFTAWARYGVQPAARLILGSPIARIETYGTYNCRQIAGSDKLSEHARGNAVDVAAFVLADGRRISIKGDWHGSGDAARFLRVVHDSACKRFMTVLSPDYNAAHVDHLHFDMGASRGFCR